MMISNKVKQVYDFNEVVNRSDTDSSKWEPECYYDVLGEKDLLPFWVADMDFKMPKPVIDKLVKRTEHGIYGYSFRNNEYYEAIINWFRKRHNYVVEKNSIIYTPGVVPAVAFAIQAFSNENEEIVIQKPVYYPFETAIKLNNRKVVDNTLILRNGRYEIDFKQLEEQLSSEKAKIFILCNPHNPTGRVFTKEELTQIGELCLKHNVLVIADEIHSDLVYRDYKHTVFAGISKEFEDITITCTAPSKTFNMAGLYASNIFIKNEEIRMKYVQVLSASFIGGQSPFSIEAARTAYTDGEEWLDQLIEYLDGNVKFITEYLEKNIPEVKMIKPEATYLGWLDFNGCAQDNIGDKVTKEAKLGLYRGEKFGDAGKGFMRICFGCPRSVLEEALDKLKNVLND